MVLVCTCVFDKSLCFSTRRVVVVVRLEPFKDKAYILQSRLSQELRLQDKYAVYALRNQFTKKIRRSNSVVRTALFSNTCYVLCFFLVLDNILDILGCLLKALLVGFLRLTYWGEKRGTIQILRVRNFLIFENLGFTTFSPVGQYTYKYKLITITLS